MKSITLLLSLTLLYSCAPLLNLKSGRTNGKNNQSLRVVAATNFYEGAYPQLDASYAYGISEKLDIGLGASPLLTIILMNWMSSLLNH